MTIQNTPFADGLNTGEQATFLGWALATEFVLPSPYALHDANPNFELAAFRFWESVESEAMAHWLDTYPGSRPNGWWWWRSSSEPLRTRLGGSGAAEWIDHEGKVTPNTGHHRFQPYAAIGITRRSPEMKAVTPELPRYQGTWRGLPVTGWDGGRGVQTIDPDDPPVFESESSYLRRRGLLLPEEAARLGDTDFAPVALVLEHSQNGGLVSVEEVAVR